ncbi:unnamed protein product [Protopolystoma xenopodis]|uniref:Uncharacterized protein n=1 Tax=Protopolystoma xenopodis TaxID=117903 RepID=A0A448X3D8_9PLAT|nr:unnamed protein product [Protopolystoma xenopodis]
MRTSAQRPDLNNDAQSIFGAKNSSLWSPGNQERGDSRVPRPRRLHQPSGDVDVRPEGISNLTNSFYQTSPDSPDANSASLVPGFAPGMIHLGGDASSFAVQQQLVVSLLI